MPRNHACAKRFAKRGSDDIAATKLQDERAKTRHKQFLLRDVLCKTKTQPVAEAHLEHRLRNAASTKRIRHTNALACNQSIDLREQRPHRLCLWQPIRTHLGRKQHGVRTRALEFR
ncbi:hypothetical protein SDC9_167514 [bioreactor metagenome]|uniref:Uncharacterized protein n=1 Tax=bioreactor metagenome TaxID=1076179 RepID=A0A645FZZ0_9ZZZZ